MILQWRPTVARLGWAIGLMAASGCAQAYPDWLGEPPRAMLRPFGGLMLWQWLGLLAVGALSAFAGWIVFKALALLLRISSHTRVLLRSLESGRGVKRGCAFLVATLVFQAGMPSLELSEGAHDQLALWLLALRVLATGFVLAAFWDVFCDRIADRAGESGYRARALLIPFAQKFGRFTLFSLALVVAFGSMGYNVGAVVAGLGIGGVAVALAAKDSIENLFGTLTLVLDLPFGIGDWVKIGSVDGTVEEINLRSTRIRTVDDSLITLPNSNLIRASVENMGRRRFRRYKTELRVRNDVEPEALRAFCDELRDVIASRPLVREDEGRVHITEVALDTIAIQVICQFEASDLATELDARHDLLLAILQLAKNRGVHLGPLPAPEPSAVPATGSDTTDPDTP